MAFDAWPPLFHHEKDDKEWMEIERVEWAPDWVRLVGVEMCTNVYKQ